MSESSWMGGICPDRRNWIRPLPACHQAPHAYLRIWLLLRKFASHSLPFLESCPAIYLLLKPSQVLSAHARLERLETMPLSDLPPVVICVETPTPHTSVL